MKAHLLTLLVCLGLLSGCCSISDTCYDNTCWNTSIVKSRCGSCIIDHCQRFCDACTFNEPACNACMACTSHEECALRESRGGQTFHPTVYRSFYRVKPVCPTCPSKQHKLYRLSPNNGAG